MGEKHKTLAARRSPDWAFMERFEVPSYDVPGENYLIRWRLIQTPWFGIMLHRFEGPDPRETLHDHPWNFVSIVLRGGYTEVVPGAAGWGGLGSRQVRRVNVKRAEDLHYIEALHRWPTWTLVLTGRRTRVWGYVDEAGWTAYDEHPHAAEFDAALAAREDVSDG